MTAKGAADLACEHCGRLDMLWTERLWKAEPDVWRVFRCSACSKLTYVREGDLPEHYPRFGLAGETQ